MHLNKEYQIILLRYLEHAVPTTRCVQAQLGKKLTAEVASQRTCLTRMIDEEVKA